MATASEYGKIGQQASQTPLNKDYRQLKRAMRAGTLSSEEAKSVRIEFESRMQKRSSGKAERARQNRESG